jgi:F0F1-type ATP synthase delta subunit
MTTEKEISIWVKALLAIMEENDNQKLIKVAKNLAAILKRKKKSYLLPKIAQKLEKAYLKKNKMELFLAKNHSPMILKTISQKLLEIFGKEKNISTVVEEDLIGGFKVKTNDFLVKASIKDFLDEFKAQLLN